MKFNTKTFGESVLPSLGKVASHAGEYYINELHLETKDGEKIGIEFIMQEMNLYESIDSAAMYGNIAVGDTNNLIQTLPIIGEETLHVKISNSKDFSDNSISKSFRIYKISNRKNISESELRYTLHFCSEDMMKDSFLRVSKSYMRYLLSDAVNEILDVNLKSDVKERFVEETKFSKCFIVPHWSPLKAITKFAGWATSALHPSKGSAFTFFETKNGYNFVSLDTLLNKEFNQPFMELNYSLLKTRTGDKLADFLQGYTRVESFEIMKNFDVLENTHSGMYGNRVITIDAIGRTPSVSNYNYLESYNELSHIEDEESAFCSEKLEQLNHPDAKQKIVLKHHGLFSQEVNDSGVNDWMSPMLSQQQQLEQLKLTMTLPGHIGLTAGHIVKFNMPAFSQMSEGGKTQEDYLDTYFSGYYLVTKVRHFFTKDVHKMSIEICKESMASSVNNSSNKSSLEGRLV